MRPLVLRCSVRWAVCVCAVLLSLSPAPAAGLANAWEDDQGHIWVETDFYLLDVSHGSTCLVKLGAEPRDWAILNVGEPVLGWHYDGTHEWSVWLGRGGGNQSSIGLYAGGEYLRTGGTITQASGAVAEVQFTGTLVVPGDVSCTFPIITRMRFRADVPLIEIHYSIANVSADPYPPAVNYAFTLVPGGDTTGDHLYWSGLWPEQSLPYGGRSGVAASSLIPVTGADGHGYVFVTDYDKLAGQGLAYFARLDQTADFVTDLNYGRLCYDDRTPQHQFSHLELCMDATRAGVLHLYFYQPDLLAPAQPVEEFIQGYGIAPFADVPFDHWAADYILACVGAGIVQGYWNGYHPDEPVTRAQMAVYIARALAGGDAGVPPGPSTAHFTDVGADHWAYRHIEYCSASSIVQGYPGGTYRPDETVNRGQMAVYIARSVVSPPGDAYLPDPTGPPAFPDVTAENEWAWCYKHVQHLAGLDPPVVQGYWDGTYRPAVEVTRDQMAVYVTRAFDLPM